MTLIGYFQHKIFQGDNGYVIYTFMTDDDRYTVLGYIDVHEEIKYELEGEFVNHPRYGSQFQVSSYRELTEDGLDYAIDFFSSSYFKGIGKVTAAKIIEQLGDDAIAKIHEDNSLIDGLDLSLKIKTALKEGFEAFDNLNIKEVEFLLKGGLRLDLINQIKNRYKENTIALLSEDPYILVKDFANVSFGVADKLALAIGFDMDSPIRKKAVVTNICLNLSFESGNSFLSYEEIEAEYCKSFNDGSFDQALKDAIKASEICVYSNFYMHWLQYEAETYIAQRLKKIDSIASEYYDDIESQIADFEYEKQLELSFEQVKAIESFFNNSLSIIIGGPGTGKTTIIEALVNILRKNDALNNVAVVSPTGRSASRIFELTQVDAKTIHSLLRWDRNTNTFTMNKDNPLLINTLIIDEFSMVDNTLFYNLLLALPNLDKLCIIGDANQLPSVNTGNLLGEIINYDGFNIISLKKIYRQSEDNEIIDLAYDVLENTVDTSKYNKNVHFIQGDTQYLKAVLQKHLQKLKDDYEDLSQFQLLSPMYKTVLGINNLNILLKDFFNPQDEDKNSVAFRDKVYQEGDKVIQLKNYNDQNVYNGDIGTIIGINTDKFIDPVHPYLEIDFSGNIVFYKYEDLQDINLAYAISIHKSQGSEYPKAIVIITEDQSIMLNKRLIYTAITRAKSQLFIYCNPGLFEKAVNRSMEKRRSFLLQFLMQE